MDRFIPSLKEKSIRTISPSKSNYQKNNFVDNRETSIYSLKCLIQRSVKTINNCSNPNKVQMFNDVVTRFVPTISVSPLAQDNNTKIYICGYENRRQRSYGYTLLNIGRASNLTDPIPGNLPSNTKFAVVINLNLAQHSSNEELFATLFHEWYAHANAGDYLQRINQVRLNGTYAPAPRGITSREHRAFESMNSPVNISDQLVNDIFNNAGQANHPEIPNSQNEVRRDISTRHP